MATPRQLYTQNNDVPGELRIAPEYAKPCELGPTAGGVTLPRGTPMAYDDAANYWVAWTFGGANNTDVIKAFISDSEEVITDDTGGTNDTKIYALMLKGRIHYDDIPLPTGELQTNLDAALRDGPLARGLKVDGLSQVR